jgi:cytochrome c oxidase subunit IV
MGSRSTRLAALSGVLFVAFLVPAVLLTSGSPGSNASAAKVQQYFLAHKSRFGASAWFSILAVLFGMFFFGYLRAYFRTQPRMEWLSSIFFGGAVIFAATGAIGAGVDGLIADHPSALTASSLQLVNQMEMDLNYPAICAGLAVLYFAAGFVIYASRALPIWLAWASWVLGLAAASFFLGWAALMGMALWAVIISIMLASRNPSLQPGAATTTAGTPAAPAAVG